MITAHPKVRIQYLRDSQAVYTANGAEGLRYATSGSVGLDLRACLEEDEAAIPAGGRLAIPSRHRRRTAYAGHRRVRLLAQRARSHAGPDRGAGRRRH